jgi:hypothetical protein
MFTGSTPTSVRIAKSEPILRVILVPTFILLAIYCFHFSFYRTYFPYGDDPALLQASGGSMTKWVTEGYSKYFVVYPEWNVARTDFLRPQVNLIVRLNETFFGNHYFLYFASCYLAQFVICVLTVGIARRMGVKQEWLLFVGALAAINPAFIGEGLYNLSFHYDIWSALFAVAALYLILRQWYGLAVLSLTLAVFTKEPALYTPVAAAITVNLIHRRRLPAVMMLFPLLLWALVWKFVFVGTPHGNYALQGNPATLLTKGAIEGFMRWPTGIVDYHAVRKILFEHFVGARLPDLLLLLINLFLWGVLLAAGVRFAKAALRSSPLSEQDRLVLAALIWLAGALSFGVLVGYHSRFGGSIYPLEILVFAVMVSQGSRTRALSAVALGLLAGAFLWNALTPESSDDGIVPHRNSFAMFTMRSLVESLQRYPADVVYVLNSARSDATPSSIASLAGVPFEEVIILNEAQGCPNDIRASRPVVQPAGNRVHVVSVLPGCANYEFSGVPLATIAQAFRGGLSRGDFATYSLPEGHVTEYGSEDKSAIASIISGKKLDLNLSPEEGKSYLILYYDWVNEKFMCAGARCATDLRPVVQVGPQLRRGPAGF